MISTIVGGVFSLLGGLVAKFLGYAALWFAGRRSQQESDAEATALARAREQTAAARAPANTEEAGAAARRGEF